MTSMVIVEGRIDNLLIGEDTSRYDDSQVAVLLFTPDMSDTSEHFHIELSRERVQALASWLQEWLEEKSK
jgi:hypothetical protein